MSEDMHNVFLGQKAISKEVVFNWPPLDEEGKFKWVPKELLNVDTKEYQRNNTSCDRIQHIAAHWSWVACGVLLVFSRRDGSLWVYDGQHRLAAAKKRTSIKKLPCLIFRSKDAEGDEVAAEAKGFDETNTVRGPVSSYDKFKSRLRAKQANCIAVKEIVDATGYTIAQVATSPKTVGCVESLMLEYARDPDAMRGVWQLCVDLAAGEPVPRRLFSALAVLHRHLRVRKMPPVWDGHVRTSLESVGLYRLNAAIDRRVTEMKKGGSTVWADGLVQYVINHGKRTRKIPSLYGAE